MIKKFSIVLIGNLKFREYINYVEGQKVRFFYLYKCFQVELIEGKKEIDCILEVVMIYFIIRDEV